MKTYARMEGNTAAEIIPPMADDDGNEIPIEDRFHSEIVATLLDVTDVEGIAPGWVRNGSSFSAPAPSIPTADDIRASYEAAAQAMLDSFAKTWGYDSLGRAATYANSKSAKYKAECDALSGWRDDVWTASESIDAAVRNGAEPPADVDAFLEMLPPPPERPTA